MAGHPARRTRSPGRPPATRSYARRHVRGVRGPPWPAARPLRRRRQRRRPGLPPRQRPLSRGRRAPGRRPAPRARPRTCCSAPAPPPATGRRGRLDEQLRRAPCCRRPAAIRPSPPPTWPPARGAESLAVEEHHLTVARHRAMGSVAPRLRLADLGTAVEQLRIVKDEEEIACLRIAAEIADQALGELLESILVGPHRAAPRPGAGAAARRPRRRRPGLPDLRRHRPALRPPRPPAHRPAGRGGRFPLRLPRRRLPRLPLRDRPYLRHRHHARGLADRAVRPRLRRSAGRAGGPAAGRRVPGRGPCGPSGAGLRGPRRRPSPPLHRTRRGPRNRRGPAACTYGHG